MNTVQIHGVFCRCRLRLTPPLAAPHAQRPNHAFLVVVESSEDQAVREYQKTLTKTLPADVHEIVQRQSHSIKQAHDTIYMMRDRLAV